MVNCCSYSITVPGSMATLRFWRNTSVANLGSGQTATLPSNTLGYEWDEALDNGFQPPGLVRLSDTTVSVPQKLTDYGSTYGPGAARHSLTLYRHPSGAMVFGAGTVQWSWGLDGDHDRGGSVPSLDMQQATVNLFADMGAQPLTIQSGLVTSAASADNLAPTSTVTSPISGSTVSPNSPVTIAGTAVDAGGGAIGSVEVSVDGGLTWHPAVGRGSWTFQWQTGGSGTASIMSRAVDDSGNLETPVNATTVTIGAGTSNCPCSIWLPTDAPSQPAQTDPTPVELGTRFRPGAAGYITAIRFYKNPANTGTHVGNLWNAAGSLLATATFSGETASGWQQVALPSPVPVSSGATYVVSYHTNAGSYVADEFYFATSGRQSGVLYAPADGEAGPNGAYRYGPGSQFPSDGFHSTNYWADVVFVTSVGVDNTPPVVVSSAPPSGGSGVGVTSLVSVTFSEPMNADSISGATFRLLDANGANVPATIAYVSATNTATLQPTATLDYAALYSVRVVGGAVGVSDLAGNELAADYVWSFSTAPQLSAGPGGPILVISSTGNRFSDYYAEILRAEGLNAFTVADIATLTSTLLDAYEVAILGEIPLTPSQISMLANWVTAGGNLIAMRPDKGLTSLLGLTDLGSTLPDGYLQVDGTHPPGAGIVTETMQFHGTADRYETNGATVVARLFSNASTATTSPAVTLRSVGTAGGQAAAFAYDLARSVVYTRQGNPAWAAAGAGRSGANQVRRLVLRRNGTQLRRPRQGSDTAGRRTAAAPRQFDRIGDRGSASPATLLVFPVRPEGDCHHDRRRSWEQRDFGTVRLLRFGEPAELQPC